MPFEDTMKQRRELVRSHLSGVYTMVEVCERYNVSRQTGHKWLKRYRESGEEGLEERSRAPHYRPHTLAPAMRKLLLETKQKYPTWGAFKMLNNLKNSFPRRKFPAVSTVNELFDANGLVKHRRRRNKHRHPGADRLETFAPNDIWTMDFKGQKKTADGKYVYPLTIVDQHTRFILAVVGLPSTKGGPVRKVLERLFKEHGMPKAIHTDNGAPFCTSNAVQGFSKLSVWFLRLGIRHSRMTPASPQQNGAHERMHRTLKAEAMVPMRKNLKEQQACFDEWRRIYNDERPHQGIDNRTPGSLWKPSRRKPPTELPLPRYPKHFETRTVYKDGMFSYKHRRIFVSHLLIGLEIGFCEVAPLTWAVYFFEIELGRFTEKDCKLIT